MGVSIMYGTGKKGIWHLGLSRSPGNKFLLGLFKVNMNIEHFYMNFFHFTKKFLPSLDHISSEIFYRTIAPPTQLIFFTDFS